MKQYRVMYRLFVALFFVSTAFSQSLSVAAKGEVAVGKEVMATTAHPLASQAAIEMLRKGGNAVDAAVAAAFAVGVVESDGSGIGGGGSMVVYLKKEKRSVFINFYQQTSENINSVNYNPKTDSRSAKAVLVPGNVAGLTTALEQYGTLPLSIVLQPAIRYAEQGFPIDETLARIILDNTELLQKYPATAEIFLPDGFPLAEGDTLRQPALAKTLRTIAEKGRKGFYEGPIAEALVKHVTENGGALTLNDLKNYKAQIGEPVRGTYRGYDIIAANAPQSGSTIIEAMNILENVNIKEYGHFSTSTESAHLIAETMRRVYSDRAAFLGDPRFVHVPNNGLTSKEFARSRFDDISFASADPRDYRKTSVGNPAAYDGTSRPQKRIAPAKERGEEEADFNDDADDERRLNKNKSDDLFDRWGPRKKTTKPPVNREEVDSEEPEKNGAVPAEDKDKDDGLFFNVRTAAEEDVFAAMENPFENGGHTTHLSVADKDGNLVSLTQTLGTFFGSGLTVEGILLNCGMANFSTTSAINSVEPNKQPRSSIAPTIILKNGDPFITVGSPGAGRIQATIILLILNLVDFGMDVGSANSAPRFYVQKFDDYLHCESRISQEVQDGLKKKGHTLRTYGDYDLFFGGAQLIYVDQSTRTYYGSADPRRGGVAIGY